ncbi:MAG: hypothetical protein QOF19_869 [Alphaproteobacteria bacterium]|nr:hypothetical protein [Alphaproteobacteria bacterium]
MERFGRTGDRARRAYLGNALGGPLGGLAGKILADAVGARASTPAAVNDALAKAQANPPPLRWRTPRVPPRRLWSRW